MDEHTAQQLVRQLKVINIWISVFGTIIVIALVVLGVLVFKVVTFVNETNTKIESIKTQTQESLDFKQKACTSDTFGNLLKDRTEICE